MANIVQPVDCVFMEQVEFEQLRESEVLCTLNVERSLTKSFEEYAKGD